MSIPEGFAGLVTPDNIATGLAALGAGAVAFIGLMRGKAKASKPNTVEVAGALIDSSMARNVLEALDRNTAALERNTATKDRLHEVLEDNTKAVTRANDLTILTGGGIARPPHQGG